MQKNKSTISGKDLNLNEQISGNQLRHSILELIQKDFPTFNQDSFLSKEELKKYRQQNITNYLAQDLDEVTELENRVIKSITDNTILSENSEDDEIQKLKFGQRIADKVATFGGSWTFIILFGVFIFIWISINIYWLSNKGFDPYPFILLNLILSCIAAMQAPVIMMSQNRQEEKDRERGKKDYLINLKSELEIRTLHEKIDHLIYHQQQHLMEIQKVQVEMMNDIINQLKKAK
ncbi:MAG TPA: DUF1003 domain-containing protein [Bacteroidia bacterium]|nr:DUF1003 domain-containing protein [Bacteroidia bacterium]